jgi:hypothetical protein
MGGYYHKSKFLKLYIMAHIGIGTWVLID